MQTGKPENLVSLNVTFSANEFKQLVKKAADCRAESEADYIHKIIVKGLQRWENKIKKDAER